MVESFAEELFEKLVFRIMPGNAKVERARSLQVMST